LTSIGRGEGDFPVLGVEPALAQRLAVVGWTARITAALKRASAAPFARLLA
jgi:hypothetical protein